jgi:mRNA-degrading endonuclease RelE of RelBE toxin-antitoxin system
MKIIFTQEFLKIYKKISKSEKEIINKLIKSIKKDPFSGKPLGSKYIREKKYKGKRLLFIVYVKINKSIYIVWYGNKKEQQKAIDLLKKKFKEL